MAIAEAIKLTYEDYLLMDQDKRYEIVDGRRYMVPAPTPYHQRISFKLARAMDEHVTAMDLGVILHAPCDVVLSPTDVVQPDIFYIARGRQEIITEHHIAGPPDLVAEILSPGTVEKDRDLKRGLYAAHGVREFWIVSPEAQTVEVLELGERGYRRVGLYVCDEELRSPSFPELVIPLAGVFAGP